MVVDLWICAQLCSQLLNVPVSRQPPFPSVPPHSTGLRGPHDAHRFVRFVGLGQIVRSDRSAVCHLQILRLAAFDSYQNTLRPTHYAADWLQLRNQFVAGVPTGRSLARSPPAPAGMVTRLGDNLRFLAPAIRFHLQASSTRTFAYTTRSHKTPPVGVQSQGTHNQQFTRSDAGKRDSA